jgi:hypothetical protein
VVDVPTWTADPRAQHWVFRAAMLLLAVGVLAFVVEGANRPADPYLEPRPAPASE